MRRLFRNSTALALGVSLSLPQLVAAQVLPASDAAEIAATRSANMPELNEFLQTEIDKGLTEDGLTCLMNAPKPCPDGSAYYTPMGIAVQLVDDGSFILAPAGQQIKKVQGGELVSVPGKALNNADAAQPAAGEALADAMDRGRGGDAAAQPEAADAARAAVADADGAASPAPVAQASAARADAPDQSVAEADQAPEAAAEQAAAEPEPAGKPVADNAESAQDGADVEKHEADAAAPAAAEPEPAEQADATPAEQPVVAEAAEPPPAAAPDPSADELAKALEEKADPAIDDTAAVAAETPAADDTPVVAAEAPAAADAAASEQTAEASTEAEASDAAANARSEPIPAPATEAGSTTVADQTGDSPTGDDRAPAADDALAEALAAAKAIPEANAKVTDAAREAAAAAVAPAAAALAESSAPVVASETTTVTEENSRQATEDFDTDLKGKGSAGTPSPQAAASADVPVVGGDKTAEPAPADNKDRADSDTDLEQALKQAVLPALAGLVVGQMLSNNREVALNTGDRVVLTRADGSQEIIKDDNALLMRPGSTVQTEEYADGSSRTVVTREDGSQVITIRDADLRILRRTVVHPDGTTTALIDETASVQPVDVAQLPRPAEPVAVVPGQQLNEETLRDALRRETRIDRSFTLGQIRAIPEVRALVAPVDIQAITFDTGSAAIKPDQAQALATLGRVIADSVRQNPAEVFLIEGHTDTVGADAMNLALSDRRAESVALALTEFFQVPPENMVVQGYGEQFLKVAREGDVRANRRASVRRITDLLARN